MYVNDTIWQRKYYFFINFYAFCCYYFLYNAIKICIAEIFSDFQ